MFRPIVAGLIALVLPNVLWARDDQADRHATGQRLRLFERALEAQKDPEGRKRALDALKRATSVFLLNQTVEAGRMLDKARRQLASDEAPDSATAWADAWAVQPERRFVDPARGPLACTIAPFYPAGGPLPEKLRLRVTLSVAGKPVGGPLEIALDAATVKFEIPLRGLREGDYRLQSEIVQAGAVLAKSDQGISLGEKPAERLAALRTALAAHPNTSVERETLRLLLTLLTGLHEGKTLETDYPAARLLKEAEEVAEALQDGRAYYGPNHAGQFWLGVPTKERVATVRVQVPEAAAKGKPIPLVVALHGAGGSENLFYDGYGDGLAARLCRARGWLFAAPRDGLPLGLIDELARIYPVDPHRIYIVGHSLGAAGAVAAASREPDRFAAVAALGGGGGFKKSDGLVRTPFFIGVGGEDFLLRSARDLRDSLKKSEVREVHYKEYAGVEHLMIVPLALGDVFSFFDDARR
jgi:predicted esterase/type II secretory pathway pseudopilin PulG